MQKLSALWRQLSAPQERQKLHGLEHTLHAGFLFEEL
jgi:hypothetical protein